MITDLIGNRYALFLAIILHESLAIDTHWNAASWAPERKVWAKVAAVKAISLNIDP